MLLLRPRRCMGWPNSPDLHFRTGPNSYIGTTPNPNIPESMNDRSDYNQVQFMLGHSLCFILCEQSRNAEAMMHHCASLSHLAQHRRCLPVTLVQRLQLRWWTQRQIRRRDAAAGRAFLAAAAVPTVAVSGSCSSPICVTQGGIISGNYFDASNLSGVNGV